MSKTIYQTVSNIKVYPIKYLCESELTESDINNLLDNNKIGLLYSIIIGMFRHIKSSKRNSQIIKIIKEKDWPYKYTWTQEQQKEYEELLIKAIKNIYQYKELQAVSLAQWYMTIYGLNVIGNKINLSK